MFQQFTMPEERWKEIKAEDDLIQSRNEATVLDQLQGMSYAFGRANFISKGIDAVQEYDYSSKTHEDSVFMENNTDERVLEVLKQNELSLKEYSDIRDAKNQIHENWLISRAKEQNRRTKFMNETLTSAQMTTGSIAGALLDIDTILVGPISGILAKGKSVGSVFKTTSAVELGGIAVKSAVDEDYGLTDAMVDLSVGLLIDTSIAKYYSRNLKRDIDKVLDDAPRSSENLQLAYEKRLLIEYKPKVDEPTYVVNRRQFFEDQRRTITGAKQADDFISKTEDTIKASNARVKALEEKLAKYNDMEELSKGQKAYQTRIKNELKKEKELVVNEKNKLSQDINYNKVQIALKETKELERKVDVIAKDFEGFTQELRATIKDLDTMDDIAKKDFTDSMQQTIDLATSKYPKEMEIAKNIFESIKHKKKGSLDIRNLSGKQKALVLGIALGGTSLMADDGTDDNIKGSHIVMAIVAAAVIGPRAIKFFKDKTFGEAILNGYDKARASLKADEIYENGVARQINGVGEYVSTKANTWINSTLQEVDNFKNPELSKFIRKLLIDPIDGSARPLEIEKNGMMRAKQYRLNTILDENFKKFKEDANIIPEDFIKNQDIKEQFNKAITDSLDSGVKSTNPHINNAVDNLRKLMDDVLDDAIEVGVKGASEVKRTSNYFPRMWKFNVLNTLLNSGDVKAIAKFKEQMTKIIRAGGNENNPEEVADKLTKWLADDTNISGKKADDIYNRLEEFLKEGVTKEDVADTLSTTADKQARMKARIDMDLSKFEDIEFTVNGIKKNITLEDIVERDIYNVMNSYLNQMYGSIALANKDWKTIKAFEDEMQSYVKGNPEVRETLEAISDLILGRPIPQTNSKAQAIVEVVKAITFTKSLPLVGFSMFPEIFKSVAYAGLPMTLKNLGSSIKKINKETEAFRVIQDLTGLGTHQARDILDMKGLDMSEYGEVAAKGTIHKLAKEFQEQTARWSQLVRLSDATQRITSLKSSTDFARWINGEDVSLIKSRGKAYGINDDLKDMFKDDFTFDKNGDLNFVNKDNWSYKKRAIFNDVIWKMNQDVTPETLLGTTGRWMRDSNVGKIFSFLLTYPINLFSTQFRRDATFLDLRTASNNFFTFTGSYLGLMARYEAEQKEYDHDMLVKYSLMNLPSFAMLGALRGLSEPATLQTLGGVKREVEGLFGLGWDELNGN